MAGWRILYLPTSEYEVGFYPHEGGVYPTWEWAARILLLRAYHGHPWNKDKIRRITDIKRLKQMVATCYNYEIVEMIYGVFTLSISTDKNIAEKILLLLMRG